MSGSPGSSWRRARTSRCSTCATSEGAALAEQLGGAATYVHCDVGDEAQWTEAMATVLDTFGRLDVLVNNAAVLHLDWIADTDARRTTTGSTA